MSFSIRTTSLKSPAPTSRAETWMRPVTECCSRTRIASISPVRPRTGSIRRHAEKANSLCRGSRTSDSKSSPSRTTDRCTASCQVWRSRSPTCSLSTKWKGGSCARGQLGDSAVEPTHQPGLEMKEASLYSNNRISGAAQQAFGLHGPRVAGSLRLTIRREGTDRQTSTAAGS